MGLSQRRVESTQAQIADVTTSSMEAYNLFLRGRAEFDLVDYVESKGYFEKAVALDSNFALAYLYLSRASGSLFDLTLAVKSITRAMALAAGPLRKSAC